MLWRIDWHAIFIPERSVLEMIVRGTIMYFVIVVLLKLVVKRQSGGIGTTDILVVVLIAEIAGPGFTADYLSVVEGAVLVATVLCWSSTIEWLSYRSPRFERFFNPMSVMLIKDGRLLARNMRAELVTKDELMTHMREEGIADISEVREACMESDGMISFIKRDTKR
ncbi:MAG: DUF421 domain-containing protein [Phycisphaerales bacterium]|nr:DUF421 domain-containing protein [Hyphomonadaceae bacterium]